MRIDLITQHEQLRFIRQCFDMCQLFFLLDRDVTVIHDVEQPRQGKEEDQGDERSLQQGRHPNQEWCIPPITCQRNFRETQHKRERDGAY